MTNVNMAGPVPMPTGNQARDIEALALHMAKLQRQMELVVEELREVIGNGKTA